MSSTNSEGIRKRVHSEQGISLSYLEKHFQRKTDITRKLADLENDVNKLEKRYIQYVEKVQRDRGKQYNNHMGRSKR